MITSAKVTSLDTITSKDGRVFPVASLEPLNPVPLRVFVRRDEPLAVGEVVAVYIDHQTGRAGDYTHLVTDNPRKGV